MPVNKDPQPPHSRTIANVVLWAAMAHQLLASEVIEGEPLREQRKQVVAADPSTGGNPG
jgi:hypothetical protein